MEGEKLRRSEQTTVNQVKQNYYGILQKPGALDSLLEAIRYYRELDRVTVDNVATGLLEPTAWRSRRDWRRPNTRRLT